MQTKPYATKAKPYIAPVVPYIEKAKPYAPKLALAAAVAGSEAPAGPSGIGAASFSTRILPLLRIFRGLS